MSESVQHGSIAGGGSGCFFLFVFCRVCVCVVQVCILTLVVYYLCLFVVFFSPRGPTTKIRERIVLTEAKEGTCQGNRVLCCLGFAEVPSTSPSLSSGVKSFKGGGHIVKHGACRQNQVHENV